MVRGTFANVRLRNRLAPGTEGGVTRLLPEGEQMSIFDASVKYAERGTPLVILAVPLLDMAWVVALRWRMGRPFYIGDTNHLSHRLARRGLSNAQAVTAIWLLAAALGGLACLWQ